MNEPFVSEQPFRVLVAGYINLNVIDGSAFFLAGLTAMCAQYPGVHVTLVAANPLARSEVVEEVLGLPNVTVIDLWQHPVGSAVEATGQTMSRSQYAAALALLDKAEPFDAIVIRDNQVACELVEGREELAARTSVYVTGVRHVGEALTPSVRRELARLEATQARFLVQTPVMREALAAAGFQELAARCHLLPPHVPDPESPFDQMHLDRPAPHRLVYTGKFFADWIPDRILAGVKAAAAVRPELHLDVAGDQFRADPDNPLFVANVKYLLESSPHITWHGGLPRRAARSLITQADLGISWRSAALDNSTELSTKVLEYGALGKAVVVNRTPMHEQILGEDYGHFANSSSDFRALLLRLPESSERLHQDARRCHEASRPHWYSNVGPDLLEFMGCLPSRQEGTTSTPWARPHVPDGTAQAVRPVLRGQWVDLQPADDGISPQAALEKVRIQTEWQRAQRRAARVGQPRPIVQPEVVMDNAGLDEARARCAKLEKQLSLAQQQRDTARRQLENLRNSRLGSLQRRIWTLRRR